MPASRYTVKYILDYVGRQILVCIILFSMMHGGTLDISKMSCLRKPQMRL